MGGDAGGGGGGGTDAPNFGGDAGVDIFTPQNRAEEASIVATARDPNVHTMLAHGVTPTFNVANSRLGRVMGDNRSDQTQMADRNFNEALEEGAEMFFNPLIHRDDRVESFQRDTVPVSGGGLLDFNKSPSIGIGPFSLAASFLTGGGSALTKLGGSVLGTFLDKQLGVQFARGNITPAGKATIEFGRGQPGGNLMQAGSTPQGTVDTRPPPNRFGALEGDPENVLTGNDRELLERTLELNKEAGIRSKIQARIDELDRASGKLIDAPNVGGGSAAVKKGKKEETSSLSNLPTLDDRDSPIAMARSRRYGGRSLLGGGGYRGFA